MPRNFQSQGTESFVGGITDYPDNAGPSFSAELENFVIARDGTIEVRHGSSLWNLNALPGSLTALQLFQLESYIFAYTDDGDIYYTDDDGASDWTQIYTAPNQKGTYGTGRILTDDLSDEVYIIPDTSIQSQQSWSRIYFAVSVTVVADANPNVININTLNDAISGLNFFEFEFEYHSGSGSTTFPWTSSNTATLEAGCNSSLPWTFVVNDVELNGTSHADITISSIDTIASLTSATSFTIKRSFYPIYYNNRLKPFVDASYNGKLSVAKYSGHLYLALLPDDMTVTPNSNDETGELLDYWFVDNKRVPLRKIYIGYDSVRDQQRIRLVSAQMPPLKIFEIGANAGSLGNGGFVYQYEVYARHTYYAYIQGELRQFIADGPSYIASVDTEYEIYDASNTLKIVAWMTPRIDFPSEITPFDEIEVLFFRTTANGATFYLNNGVPGEYGLSYNDWLSIFSPSSDEQAEVEPHFLDADEYIGRFYGLRQDDYGSLDGTASTNIAYANQVVDSLVDSDLVSGEVSYDSGVSTGYLSIPQGPYYFTIANQIGYYANIYKLSNRVYQSIYGIPHAVTALTFTEYDDYISGLSSYRNKAIIATKDSTWRQEGIRGLDGRGNLQQVQISDEFGCVANASMIRTNVGVFFFSRTGICYTDGFKVLRVSEQLYDTYFRWLEDTSYITAYYHVKEQRIYWSVKMDGKPYWVAMFLRYGVSRTMPITLITGYEKIDVPVDTTQEESTVYRFDSNVCLVNQTDQVLLRHQDGYVLNHLETDTTDYYPDDSADIPIIFNYKSIAFNGGSKKLKKWFVSTTFGMNEYNDAGVTCLPTSYNELSPTRIDGSPCYNYSQLTWGEAIQTWGNPDALYNTGDFKIKFRRMFKEGTLRATYKQFGITSLYLVGPDSDTHGGATYTLSVDGGTGAQRTVITIPISLATAASEMQNNTVDDNGGFAIKLPAIWGDVWLPIWKVTDNTTTFDVYIESDPDANTGMVVNDVTWSIGYIRTAERIGLDYFEMRYALIGEYADAAYDETDGADNGG